MADMFEHNPADASTSSGNMQTPMHLWTLRELNGSNTSFYRLCEYWKLVHGENPTEVTHGQMPLMLAKYSFFA